MNISHIGKQFVKFYNEQKGKNYTVEQFFDKFVWEYIYNVSTPFLSSNNCTLNVKSTGKDKDTGKSFDKIERYASDITYRKQVLKELHENVNNLHENGVLTGLSTYPGFPTEKTNASTAGQRSFGIDYDFNKDLVYGAFIGFALSISVDNILILTSDMDLNMRLFESWKKIKAKYDNAPKMVSGILNSVLGHVLIDGFQNKLPDIPLSPATMKKGYSTVKSIGWVQFFEYLGYYFEDKDSISVYAYALGNQNSTYGIVHFSFPEVRDLENLVKSMFDDYSADYANFTKTIKPTIDRLYSFERALIDSPIGIRHLEPKGVNEERQYAKSENKGKPIFSYKKDLEKFLYSKAFILTSLSYTWSKIAMNTSVIEAIKKTAQAVAKAIYLYKSGEEIRTNRTNTINDVLKIGFVKKFAKEFESKILRNVIGYEDLSPEDVETIQSFLYMCATGGDDKLFRDMSSMIMLIRMEYSILDSKK